MATAVNGFVADAISKSVSLRVADLLLAVGEPEAVGEEDLAALGDEHRPREPEALAGLEVGADRVVGPRLLRRGARARRWEARLRDDETDEPDARAHHDQNASAAR